MIRNQSKLNLDLTFETVPGNNTISYTEEDSKPK